MLKKLYAKTNGYKTYLTSAVALAVVILKALGYLTPDQYQALLGLLGAFGMYSLRDGIKKLEK